MYEYLSTFNELELFALCWLIVLFIFLIIFLVIEGTCKLIYIIRTPVDQRIIDWCNETFEMEQKIMESTLARIKVDLGLNGKLTCARIDGILYFIYLDHEYFGIYDTRRNTFVD